MSELDDHKAKKGTHYNCICGYVCDSPGELASHMRIMGYQRHIKKLNAVVEAAIAYKKANDRATIIAYDDFYTEMDVMDNFRDIEMTQEKLFKAISDYEADNENN